MSFCSVEPLPALHIMQLWYMYIVQYMERTEKGTIFRNEVKERQEQRIDAAKRDKLLEQEMNKVRDYVSDLVGDLCA